MQIMQTTYSLGLDIGIASVGWCVLGEERIIDLGVRAFDKAETAKEGDSLNLIRRQARLMRRRLCRRAWRLTKLARALKHHGLIDDTDAFGPKHPTKTSPWQLRVAGLDRLLSQEEWARVIYHLCKHRGFHWVSRAEEKAAEGDGKSEGGKVKTALEQTKTLKNEKNYRTAAEMVLAEFPEAQRNKQGDYGKALSRVLLSEELGLLFARQRALGNPHTDTALEALVLGNGDRRSGLFWAQKPALTGAAMLERLGRCTLESAANGRPGGPDGKGEYRAPKASFTAERHVWLTRLNNLRVVVDGQTRGLSEAERRLALPLPYQQASDFTYRQLRNALVKAGFLPEEARFAGLSYPSEAQKTEGKAKDPEAATLVKLPGWQALRRTLKKADLETEWEGMAGAAMGGNPALLDDIARVLSIFKDDDEVRAELRKLPLPNPEKMVEALLDIRFDKFHALSLKALHNIVPHMERGLRYDEACVEAGYHHSQLHVVGGGSDKYLPPFYASRDKDGRMVFRDDADIPRNPVVLRALNQARKVVNAIVRKYGSPQSVHIEMARDLSRPLDERNKIKKEQEEYRARNEDDWREFTQAAPRMGLSEVPDRDRHGKDFAKWQLYREQQGKCAYSVSPLDIDRLLERGYVEIDHALPRSRSFDNSKNNKVLVLAKENREKGNRTPYEYLKAVDGCENGERWRSFVAFVEANKQYRMAKRSRLLRKDFGKKEAEEFRERNLNDTRFICRFFKNYVERYLQLAEGSEARRCVVVSGQLTAFLRARWGLNKVRSESDRHHALDAAVVAACSHGMVKRLSDYARRRELDQVREGFVDVETGEIVNPAMYQQLREHFPDPWPHFRDELKARLYIDSAPLLREGVDHFGTYPEEAIATLKPLFVSRAPQRRNSGAAHKDTIYGQPERLKAKGGVTQKVPLSSLTLKDLEKLSDPERNAALYEAIRLRLEAHGGKGDKAFPPSNPLRKPGKLLNKETGERGPDGPIVRTATMVIDKLSGIPVRGGIAKNDSMLRVDVFRKEGKFHLVPVYVHHTVAKELPNRAIIAHKLEDQWTQIDNTFSFVFSLHPNDLVRITLGDQIHTGYFGGCDRSDGKVGLWIHDRNKHVGSDGLVRIASKTAKSFEKFHVDVLGNIYPAPPEERRGLA